MQFISTKYHAVLDYIIGTALICTPWIFYKWDNSLPMWVLSFAGIWLISYSLVTRYEYSLLKIIPMPFHLTLDMALGMGLIGSPWFFGFENQLWIPHIGFGLMQILITIFSSPKRAHQLYTGYHAKYKNRAI
jgi:hypothetical protein